MKKSIKETLSSAIKLLEASNRRAQNTAKHPQFKPVLEAIENEIREAETWLAAQKED